MEKLLTAKQVSDLLEVTPSTVYDWVHRGIIPYVRLSRAIRFKKNDIFHWVDSHTLKPKTPTGRKKPTRNPDLQKEFPL